ncbi:MAG TPA: maleylacetoacetate isomerase [Polyangiales bacterium]|nr:maleylacetoacetate isomerase [Polyangiales bacterium]
MRLYSYWRSSSAYRVRIVLALKAVPYEYVAVNLLPTICEQRSEAFAAINPMQQVPTLEWTDGSRLTQSVAIVELLDELHPEPPLLPKQPLLRARVREIVELINSGIQPLQNTATLAELRRLGGEDAARSWAASALAQGLAALEARAQPGRFLVGDAPSLADVFLVPQLYNARRFGLALEAYPRLLAAEVAANALPAFQRARPEAQPDAPLEDRS